MATIVGVFTAAPAVAGGPHYSAKDGAYYHEAGSNWSGLYIGAAIGLNFGSTDLIHDWTDVGPVDVRDTYSSDRTGMTATVTVGFDQMINQHMLWGIFADYTVGSIRDRVTLATPGNVDLRLKVEDSWAVGGRTGLVRNGALWYLAAGYTGTQVHFAGFDETLHGYFIGGGIEKDLHPNVRLKLEYRYSDYDSETLFSSAGCCDERLDIETSVHSVRLGLSYVFGGHAVQRHESFK